MTVAGTLRELVTGDIVLLGVDDGCWIDCVVWTPADDAAAAQTAVGAELYRFGDECRLQRRFGQGMPVRRLEIVVPRRVDGRLSGVL